MDSWTLQGDSYSFLRSATRPFSLCHRDGTPNHVEIFDIINVPGQRNAISETTCLCEIFGDDCESPSPSSSPVVGAFVTPQREVEGTAAASPLVDDLNDSSGSYHSAQGFSEGEESFQDSRERLYSPLQLNKFSERSQQGGKMRREEHSEVTEDTHTKIEPKIKSPVRQLSPASPITDVLNTTERTPPPGHNRPDTLSPAGRVSSSYSPYEAGCSPTPTNPEQQAEQLRINPNLERDKSPSHHSLTPSPSLDPRSRVSPSSSQLRIPQQQSGYFIQHNSPSPTSKDLDFTESAFESGAIFSSPVPSSSSTELLFQSGGTPVSPELKKMSPSPDSQASSPFPEQSGRISLPDLFSRGSTPDIEDFTQEISNLSTVGRDTTSTPESQSIRLSAEPVSTASTPALRCTPPSHISSIESSPELRSSRVTSPATRTPSPGTSNQIRHISTPSEIQTQGISPVMNCNLSPSPDVISNYSHIENRYSSPSPEIIITASSPRATRRSGCSAVGTSASPLSEPKFGSVSPKRFTSSPHITGSSYTDVQPEDRDNPAFPELSRLSNPEPGRKIVPSERRTPTQGRDNPAEFSGIPHNSPYTPEFTGSIVQPEVTHQPRYQTPSPQPKHYTPSPELRYKTTSGVQHHSSPQRRSRTPSSAAPSPEQRYHQHSPANLSTGYSPENYPLRNTSDCEGVPLSDDITETQYAANVVKESVSPSFESNGVDISAEAEIQSRSSLASVSSPVSSLPSLVEEKSESLLKQERREPEVTPLVENLQDNSSVVQFSGERQTTGPSLSRRRDIYHNRPTDVKSLSLNLVSKDGTLNGSHNRAPSKSPTHRLEKPKPQVTSYSLSSENSSSSKTASVHEHARRQPTRRENHERLAAEMPHHVHRRRTPSPPLTRFTPVHILAPQKPCRNWQNRSHSPSMVVASSVSHNLKSVVTNRESPNVTPDDNNSQAHWARLGTQLEMEREMHLEEDREVGREKLTDKENVQEREREREEQLPEKGTGWEGDTSYRGEQVELSFNARNRKGPGSHRAVRTSRQTCEGLPTVHSFSESLLTTRHLQQQQRLLKLASQQDTKGGGSGRRLQPPSLQNKNSTAGRVTAYRPCQSSSSSMGSELDDTDNEVKWCTDSAFSSLSSPGVDYLDMYNSSHRSSTNISQPSTQESPAGVSAAWLAYADFKGSDPKLDNDELSFQRPPAYNTEGPDPSRPFELGSFECIDVVVEREDTRKIRRGVPKRQIQLKRRDNTEGSQDDSSQNSSPTLPGMESPSIDSRSRETIVRQHSTPAAIQECFPTERSPELSQHNKRELQKSASLDEACTKTRMATCLIKNVLSKKMQSVDTQPDEQAAEFSPACEENSQIKNESLRESSKSDAHSLQSDYNLSSEGVCIQGEEDTKDEAKPPKSFGGRFNNRPSSCSSSRSLNFPQNESDETDSQSRQATSLRSGKRTQVRGPFDNKQSTTSVQLADNSKTWDRREGGDSSYATDGNTGAPSTHGARAANRDQECVNTDNHKQLQQGDNCSCTLNTDETSLKAMEKKKASLNVCLTPEAENKPWASSPDLSYRESEGRVETTMDEKTEEHKGNDKNQGKIPSLKVRDVRRLVKNTYNLSFKAAGVAVKSNVNDSMTGNVNEEEKKEESREKKEKEIRLETKKEQVEDVKDSKMLTLTPALQTIGNPPSRPQPMQIEYKAVCWKEDRDKTLCSMRHFNAKTQNYTAANTGFSNSCQYDQKMTAGTRESMTEMHEDNEGKPVVVRADRKPPMLGSLPRVPSKEREVSTAVMLIKDGFSKTDTSAPVTKEKISTSLHPPAAPHSLGPTTHGSSGHSVSMLLKEKGYQAEIGAVVGDNQNTAACKNVPCKHVNCLEVPLQTSAPSDMGWIQSQREETVSSSSSMSGPCAMYDNTETLTKTGQDSGESNKSTIGETVKQRSVSLVGNNMEQTPAQTKYKDLGDFEAVKRLDPTFPPRSPEIRTFRSQAIEVKSVSKEVQKKEIPTNSTANSRPQTIEVKSIAKNSQKPVVPPKPSCKFKPADFGAMSSEAKRRSAPTSTFKPQSEDRPQTIVVSSPTIYRKISNESTSASNYTRKLSVSAVSSLKPPPCKKTETATTTGSNQPMDPSKTEASNDGRQQHRPTTIAPTPTTTTVTGLTSISGPETSQVLGPAPTGSTHQTGQQARQAAMDVDSQPQYHRIMYPHQQAKPAASNNAQQSPAAPATQAPGYTRLPCHRSFSGEHSQRTDDLQFYDSDDPPSYDDRECFSPLMLSDLTPRRSNLYQPVSRPPPCSCIAGCSSHSAPLPPHHRHTPPAPPHSPGQALPYLLPQPPLHTHHGRSDLQRIGYQPSSPKLSPTGPSQPPAMYQPVHRAPPCPPDSSLIQACPADRPLQATQHIDSRRPPVHRSPQQQPPSMARDPYCDRAHSHSPGLPPMDPQYLCGPQGLGPSYGSEYGGDNSSSYSESSYAQTPRRVLFDPETGKYFYIEVPVQPLRKMLFDPETGQYVEVLIPQQTMSNSGLYPPSAAPYQTLHNPSMYASTPQYMPYAAPPPPPHPQPQSQQPPRYPEASTAASHQSGPGLSYRPSVHASKPEPQNHPPLDQSYLENMYYVPTGMAASPNPTPPDYYHKHPPNLPPTGRKRS